MAEPEQAIDAADAARRAPRGAARPAPRGAARPAPRGAGRPALALAAPPTVTVLLVAALALVAEALLAIATGGHPPGWAIWVCSHSPVGSIRRFAPSGRLGAAFRASQQGLAVHWPHLIPIPLAFATLLYLHRAGRQSVSRAT